MVISDGGLIGGGWSTWPQLGRPRHTHFREVWVIQPLLLLMLLTELLIAPSGYRVWWRRIILQSLQHTEVEMRVTSITRCMRVWTRGRRGRESRTSGRCGPGCSTDSVRGPHCLRVDDAGSSDGTTSNCWQSLVLHLALLCYRRRMRRVLWDCVVPFDDIVFRAFLPVAIPSRRSLLGHVSQFREPFGRGEKSPQTAIAALGRESLWSQTVRRVIIL